MRKGVKVDKKIDYENYLKDKNIIIIITTLKWI
jgi:hypothetical protein